MFFFYVFGGMCFLLGTILFRIAYTGKIKINGNYLPNCEYLNFLRWRIFYLGVGMMLVGLYSVIL